MVRVLNRPVSGTVSAASTPWEIRDNVMGRLSAKYTKGTLYELVVEIVYT
jgi:hypothetical protein